MTADLKKTWLWHHAFVEHRKDCSGDEQNFFRQHLEGMRERVEPLVARVMRDMPGYTVHDISHLDALWETASLVASTGLAFNPPEAFVFGGAVLLHDAAMTLAAYPEGLAGLKETCEWADMMALCTDSLVTPKAESREVEIQVTIEVLRRLHAQKATEVAIQGWRLPNRLTPKPDASVADEQVYLIENSDLRHFYGSTIGVVAHSHWWPIARVERELCRVLGGMAPKTQLSVDLLKIACLLRVADSLHLDRRRAPPFVRALDQPGGVSALHWAFQSKLAFPHIQDDAVVFTAGEACTVHEADAWWCGFDAFGLANRELRDANLVLLDNDRAGFKARRVKGANDPHELAKFVPVSGWQPVETQVRVSDVPNIVDKLGGANPDYARGMRF